MIDKYGNKIIIPEPAHVVIDYDDAPAVFHDDEVVDYNVGRPKPKRVAVEHS